MKLGLFNGIDSLIKIPDSVDYPYSCTVTFLTLPLSTNNGSILGVGSDKPNISSNMIF